MRGEPRGCILAVAGRRIDAVGAQAARFPLAQAERVSAELRQLVIACGAAGVVASAANGADLLALEAAGELGLRRTVLLPGPAAAFRAGSVIDRPGDFGPRFDRIVGEVRASGGLTELDLPQTDDAYARVTEALISRTGELAKEEGLRPAAVVVWDGVSRGPEDMTAYFRRLAVERRFDLHEVRTLP